jgi:hypothetical protein
VPLARSGFPISCASGVYRFRQPACAASDPNRGEKPHSQGAGTLRLAQSVSCSESFVISVRSYRTHSKLAVSFNTPVARIYLSPFRGPSRFKSREISRAVRPATYSPKAVGQWRPRLLSSAAPPCRQAPGCKKRSELAAYSRTRAYTKPSSSLASSDILD